MWKANVSRNRGGKDKTIREVHKDAEQKLAEFQSLVVSAVSQPDQAKSVLNDYASIVLPSTTTPQGENYLPYCTKIYF